jgi:hypothetical protein
LESFAGKARRAELRANMSPGRRDLTSKGCGQGGMQRRGRASLVASVVTVVLLASGSAHSAAVPSVLHPPSLRLHSASHAQPGRGSYLVAGGNARKQRGGDDDEGVITIQLNLKPFLSALRAQLAMISNAVAVVGGSVAAAGGSVAGASIGAAKAAREIGGKAVSSSMDAAAVARGALASAGSDLAGAGISAARAGVKLAESLGAAGESAIAAGSEAAREALAQAQKAALEIEDLVKANPNEAAAVGVTLAAVAALRAVLASPRPEAVPELPPSLPAKLRAAAAASADQVGGALSSAAASAAEFATGARAAANSMVVLPSVGSVSQTLGAVKNATVEYYLAGVENTLLLFGSVVAATVNVSNTCYVRAFMAVHRCVYVRV